MEKYTAEQVVEKLKELAGWTFNDEGIEGCIETSN